MKRLRTVLLGAVLVLALAVFAAPALAAADDDAVQEDLALEAQAVQQLSEPYRVYWSLSYAGDLVAAWEPGYNIPDDGAFSYKVAVYADGVLQSTYRLPSSTQNIDLTATGDVPLDSSSSYAFSVQLVPAGDTGWLASEAMTSNAIVPATDLVCAIRDVSFTQPIAGDRVLNFAASWSGVSGTHSYLWVELKITPPGQDTITIRPGGYGLTSYGVAGTSPDFYFSADRVRHTFAEGEHVQWRVYLADRYGELSDPAVEVTGEFTVSAAQPVTVNLHANGHGRDYVATVPYGTNLSGDGTTFDAADVSAYTDIPQFIDGYVRVGWATSPMTLDQVTYDTHFSANEARRESGQTLDVYAVWVPGATAAEVNVRPPVCGQEVKLIKPISTLFYPSISPIASVPRGVSYHVDGMDAHSTSGDYTFNPPDMMWWDTWTYGRPALFQGRFLGGVDYSFGCDIIADDGTVFDAASAIVLTGNYKSGSVDYSAASRDYQLYGGPPRASSHAHATITTTAVHDWTPWETVEPATLEVDGVDSHTCMGCGKIEERTVLAGNASKALFSFAQPAVGDALSVGPEGQDPAPAVTFESGEHVAVASARYCDVDGNPIDTDMVFEPNSTYYLAVDLEADEGWRFAEDFSASMAGAELVSLSPSVDQETGLCAMRAVFTFDTPIYAVFGVWLSDGAVLDVGGGFTVGYEGIPDAEAALRPKSGSVAVPMTSLVTLTAVPDEGYVFEGWYEANSDYAPASSQPTFNRFNLLSSDPVYSFPPRLTSESNRPCYCAVFERDTTGPAVWERLWGNIALDTMESIVREGWKPGDTDTVIVATSGGYHDALAAAPLAGVHDAPVLLTRKQELSQQTRDAIAYLGATHAIIVGGPAAVSDDAQAQLEELLGAGNVRRVYGDNAQTTAVAIASCPEVSASWPYTCIVATSKGYQDALAIAPYAFARGIPVYLTKADGTLRPEVATAIAGAHYSRAIVVGGNKAIPDATIDQLEDMGARTERLWGDNAIETANRIATWCVAEQGMSADRMGVATAGGYHDALAGAALCGRNNSVLVLVNKAGTNLYAADHFAKDNKDRVATGYIFGGTVAVSDQVKAAFEKATS